MPHNLPTEQGLVLAPLRKGPLTSSHLVRWCAAQQNWDKIHYDTEYAKNVAGMKERVINGGLKQHYLTQMLQQNLGDTVHIARLKYEFVAPDFIGETLEVRGEIAGSGRVNGQRVVQVNLHIWNLDQQKTSTTAKAVVTLPTGTLADNTLIDDFLGAQLNETVQPADPLVPQAFNNILGTVFEQLQSAYPLDLSRLRLFCDAVGGMAPLHYDRQAAREAGAQTVPAPHLFPIHGIEARPDTQPLSTDPQALGREAMSEPGRNFGRMFGLPNKGMVNGGNDVEFHSFLQVGETVKAQSTLLEARLKHGREGGAMLITTSLNSYFTTTGRLLMRERQSIIYRNFQ